VARFYGAPAGSVIPVTEFTQVQLADAFGTTDGIALAAFSSVRVDGDADHPFQTCWATRKRTDIGQQSLPWQRQGGGTLGLTSSKMSSIGTGVFTYSNNTTPGADNTTTAVVIPSSNPNGYTSYIGAGNFKLTFQGNVENVAATDFSSATAPIRSDFYEIVPGSGNSTYLGYFEFTPAGALSFHAASPTLPPLNAPTIQQVTRNGNTTTLTITSETGGKYQVVKAPADLLQSPLSSWAPVGSPVSATGSSLVLTVDSTADAGFYGVVATR
jgi:hypothetical protein